VLRVSARIERKSAAACGWYSLRCHPCAGRDQPEPVRRSHFSYRL